MDLIQIIIPIVSVCIPFIILFMTRGLEKGTKDRIEIRNEIDSLSKEVSTNARNIAILEERLKNYFNGSRGRWDK